MSFIVDSVECPGSAGDDNSGCDVRLNDDNLSRPPFRQQPTAGHDRNQEEPDQ